MYAALLSAHLHFSAIYYKLYAPLVLICTLAQCLVYYLYLTVVCLTECRIKASYIIQYTRLKASNGFLNPLAAVGDISRPPARVLEADFSAREFD